MTTLEKVIFGMMGILALLAAIHFAWPAAPTHEIGIVLGIALGGWVVRGYK